MNDTDLTSILDFLRATEPLKDTLRRSYTAKGRPESTAEHTWRLCLMALLFEDHYPDLDILKLIKICIIHDLGETLSGDIAAVDQVPGSDKSLLERQDLKELVSPLPESLREKILDLWDDYDQTRSQEAQLAKAFDKLETILQHTQGKNPPDFDYGFNLSYGKAYTDFDGVTQRLRAFIDQDTTRLAQKNNTIL